MSYWSNFCRRIIKKEAKLYLNYVQKGHAFIKTRKIESYDKIALDTSAYEMKEVPETENKPSVAVKQADKIVINSAKKKPLSNAPAVHLTKPQVKKRIENKSVPTSTVETPISVVPRNSIQLKKRKLTHSRIIAAKSSGFNKLYDV